MVLSALRKDTKHAIDSFINNVMQVNPEKN